MLSEEALARLAPNRTHESNWIKSLFCRFGLHRWYYPNLAGLGLREERIGLCRWCDQVKLPGR